MELFLYASRIYFWYVECYFANEGVLTDAMDSYRSTVQSLTDNSMIVLSKIRFTIETMGYITDLLCDTAEKQLPYWSSRYLRHRASLAVLESRVSNFRMLQAEISVLA